MPFPEAGTVLLGAGEAGAQSHLALCYLRHWLDSLFNTNFPHLYINNKSYIRLSPRVLMTRGAFYSPSALGGGCCSACSFTQQLLSSRDPLEESFLLAFLL